MNLMLLIATVMLLYVSAPAFACKPIMGLASNKRIANIQQRLADGKKINAKQRVLYADYQKDDKAYQTAIRDAWPVCSELGGTDCFPNCSQVSAREMDAAPYVKDGLHYRVSPAKAQELENTKLFLTDKWKQ